jgi:hypothetical protein
VRIDGVTLPLKALGLNWTPSKKETEMKKSRYTQKQISGVPKQHQAGVATAERLDAPIFISL